MCSTTSSPPLYSGLAIDLAGRNARAAMGSFAPLSVSLGTRLTQEDPEQPRRHPLNLTFGFLASPTCPSFRLDDASAARVACSLESPHELGESSMLQPRSPAALHRYEDETKKLWGSILLNLRALVLCRPKLCCQVTAEVRNYYYVRCLLVPEISDWI